MTSAAGKEVPVLEAGEARAVLSSGGAYLDVRMREDFDKDHAAGARNVPYYLSVTPQGKEKNPHFFNEVAALYGKEQHLIVGCRTGVRAKLATSDLINTGFGNSRTRRLRGLSAKCTGGSAARWAAAVAKPCPWTMGD